MKLLIINGPNLNMLGIREKNIYGTQTFQDLEKYILDCCREQNVEAELFQSNHEGAIVDKIQQAYGVIDGIVINPAAYTHTSVAIADAVAAIETPVVEVHITNIYAREEERRVSLLSKACVGVISGFGLDSYRLAVESFFMEIL